MIDTELDNSSDQLQNVLRIFASIRSADCECHVLRMMIRLDSVCCS
jgi:hypothetical protein